MHHELTTTSDSQNANSNRRRLHHLRRFGAWSGNQHGLGRIHEDARITNRVDRFCSAATDAQHTSLCTTAGAAVTGRIASGCHTVTATLRQRYTQRTSSAGGSPWWTPLFSARKYDHV